MIEATKIRKSDGKYTKLRLQNQSFLRKIGEKRLYRAGFLDFLKEDAQ